MQVCYRLTRSGLQEHRVGQQRPIEPRLYWRMLARQQLHRPRATKPLWRRAQGPGSGLGLSILQAICERYGAELKLQLRNIGLTICLALALAPTSNIRQLFI